MISPVPLVMALVVFHKAIIKGKSGEPFKNV